MSEEIKELTIVAELVHSGKVIGTIDKTFFLLSSEEQNSDTTPKGIDETLTEFLQELEAKVAEKNLRIANKDDFYGKAVLSLILYFAKPSGVSAKLKVPVESVAKKEAEGEEDGTASDS